MKLFNAQSKKVSEKSSKVVTDLSAKKLSSEFLNEVSGGWGYIPLPVKRPTGSSN